ncbi:MAG: O-antigen ligase family protein [Thermomicrobiales bacterium]
MNSPHAAQVTASAVGGRLANNIRIVAARDKTVDAARGSRWVFVALCGYIASQAYTLPILPIGPWPVWPGLPDVMFGALVLAWLFMDRSASDLRGVRRTMVQVMALLTIAGIASYVTFTLLLSNLNTRSFGIGQQGPAFGLFEVVRMVQFLVLFRVAAGVPLSEFRVGVLRRIVIGAFLITTATVIVTFHNVIPTGVFAPLLPRDQAGGGAWWYYVHNYDGFGLGTISYTHAYVAAQITLLLGLALHLSEQDDRIGKVVLIGLALVASLLSGSRAGFAGVLLVAGLFILSKSPRWLVNFVLISALVGVSAFVYASSHPSLGGGGPIGSILQHQVAAFAPFESKNLVGRNDIWAGRLHNLNSHPWRWFTGWGVGSSPDTGPALSPHMLPLQIIMELGFGTLLVLALICRNLLRNLWRREQRSRPFFWTTIALLVSSATQETFYPVPSTGYLLGFYLVCLAIVLRTREHAEDLPESPPIYAEPMRTTSPMAGASAWHRVGASIDVAPRRSLPDPRHG